MPDYAPETHAYLVSEIEVVKTQLETLRGQLREMERLAGDEPQTVVVRGLTWDILLQKRQDGEWSYALLEPEPRGELRYTPQPDGSVEIDYT